MRHAAAAVLVLMCLATVCFAQAPPAATGWVVLPVADYRALREKAYPPPPLPEPPPVNAAITRVEYDLDVQGDAATGRARLTIDVFKDGWVSVPIPAELRVREARIDGRPLTLLQGQEGRGPAGSSVLLSHAGRSVITLDLTVPITAGSGVDSIVLPATATSVQRVTLALQSADLTLNVSGGSIAERSGAGQPSRFLVCGRPNEPLALSWSRRRDNPSAALPLRIRGAVTELVGLAEDSAQVSAQVGVEVLQGVAERVTLTLPQAFAVSQVSGALVADWEARGSTLVVSLLEPVDRTVGITVGGELRSPREGKIEVPIIRVVGAERETGGVAVEVIGAGEIKESSPRGLEAADPSDLGAMIAARQSPALVAFRWRPQPADAPRSLDVTVARYTPQAVLLANIEEARYTALFSEDGKTLVEAAYAIRNSQRSFVAVTLPAGATLWSASIDGRPVRPGRTAEGALLLPILKDRGRSNVASAVRLFFIDRGTRWASNGTATLRLPAVDLPVSRTGVQIYYSPRYHLTLEPGPFRVEPYAEPLNGALRAAGGGLGAGRGDAMGRGIGGGVAGSPSAAPAAARVADQEMKDLVGQYQRENRSGAIAGLLPLELQFPAFGPSIFAASELTPESKAPEARFTFKREVN